MTSTRALVKLGVASTCVLGSQVFAPMLAEGAIGTLLLTALGNVALGNTANAIDALTERRRGDDVSLENADLTRAVGKAIAAVIILEAKKRSKESSSGTLKKIADKAEKGWVEIFQQELAQENYPALNEAELDQFLTPSELSLTQEGNLSVEDWKSIFARLNMAAHGGGGFSLPSQVFQSVGELLHSTFPKALRQTLKEDFANDGKAFAGLTLQLLTEMKRRINDLQVTSANDRSEILVSLGDIEERLSKNEEEQQNFFRAVSEHIDSGFEQVLVDLGFVRSSVEEIIEKLETPRKIEEEWRELCKKKLDLRKGLTTNLFTNRDNVTIEVKDVYTPLAIVERKDPPKDKQSDQQLSAEEGSRQYREETLTPITEEEFLKVLQTGNTQKSQGKRIVIIGEPGSGKTTRLQMLADWILEEQLGLPIWISLADLGTQSLSNYLEERWLHSEGENKYWEDLKDQFKTGKVWLLLDGLDEWTARAGSSEVARLLEGFTGEARVVLTCRSNVWDTGVNAFSRFDVFRNRDFEPGQVKEYIEKWFAKAEMPEAGMRLQAKLEEPGQERLRDLIRNPLRLSLLCGVWHRTEGELPKTKAGLYQNFVDQIYAWKSSGRLETDIDEQWEINKALANLALEGMLLEETSGLSRFRLSERTVKKCLGTYFNRVKDLGWINSIGIAAENPLEDVYAFYHATFQEYFAALSIPEWQDEEKQIPGWDFFMPHDHQGRPVPGKKYRAFDPRWKEVILLWLGRDDVPEEHKKAFLGVDSATGLAQMISSFGGSGDGCGDFYGWKAAFLQIQATAEVAHIGELKGWVEKCISKMVQWAFGKFDPEQGQWVTPYEGDPVSAVAKDRLLAEANRPTTIATLRKLLDAPGIDEFTRMQAAAILGRIDPGNETAIAALMALLSQPEIDGFTRMRAAAILGRIGQGNETAIAALVARLSQPGIDDWQAALSLETIDPGNERAIAVFVSLLSLLGIDDSTRWKAALILGGIGQGNERAIAALVALLSQPGIDDSTRMQAALSLETIDPGNETAIAALVARLPQPGIDDSTRMQAALSLETVDPGNETAIAALAALLSQPGKINDSTRWEVYKVLWQFAQKLDYEGFKGFYAAWNHQLPTPDHPEAPQNHPVGKTSVTESLESQTFDIDGYRQILNQDTEKLILLIDTTSFQDSEDPSEIIQEICSELYLSDPEGSTFVGDCPEVSTPTDLKRILVNALRKQSKRSWLLILHATSPAEVFQTTISHVKDCHWINLSQLTPEDFRAWVSERL